MTIRIPAYLRATTVLFIAAGLVALPAGAGDHAKKDIVDTAVAAGDFTTLVTAIETAGLVDALKGEGPFTVFAPTNTAFAKLPAGTVESLLEPKNREKLQAILTFHVVPGSVPSSAVKDGASAATLQGGNLGFAVSDGTVRVNEATVTTADIETSNGVIHVIDTVLLPE